MLFNSIQFLIFFPVVTVAYFALPHRTRWAWLLAASCLFYMAFIPSYILILLVTIVIDYCAAILMEDRPARWRRPLLIASITSTCLVLAVFKYLGFIAANAAAVARALHLSYVPPALSVILPIGLSFHTFQSLSYVVEVYRGQQRAERHFGIYALYVMFYPQLVAGPIERPQNLLHQFRTPQVFDYARVRDGLKLMAWGLFKKVVIADRLSMMVNPVFDRPREFGGLQLIVASVFFAYQIYCDFSGYSDIAIGAARVMGFRLMTNFDRPYQSTSVREFWRRWHISLSTWFRDYLYTPLGGNRRGRPRQYASLICTFLVSGLWHGANWTFVVWGFLHGIYVVCGLVLAPVRARLSAVTGLAEHPLVSRMLSRFFVFALVGIGWIVFRAQNLSDAAYIITHLTSSAGATAVAIERSQVLFGVVLILFLESVQALQNGREVTKILAARPAVYRWTVYFGLVYSIIFLGAFGDHQFIYFQF
jgi:alginate O-acetyltransferase complex protein AlgI